MEKINGVPTLNLSGIPLGKAASWLPARLKAEKIVLFPDLCPGKAPLPTGCAIQLNPADEPDWRKYTLSDVGCGIAVYSSPLTLEEFERRREDWDALTLKITARKGGLGELGGGCHRLFRGWRLAGKPLPVKTADRQRLGDELVGNRLELGIKGQIGPAHDRHAQ